MREADQPAGDNWSFDDQLDEYKRLRDDIVRLEKSSSHEERVRTDDLKDAVGSARVELEDTVLSLRAIGEISMPDALKMMHELGLRVPETDLATYYKLLSPYQVGDRVVYFTGHTQTRHEGVVTTAPWLNLQLLTEDSVGIVAEMGITIDEIEDLQTFSFTEDQDGQINLVGIETL